MVIGPVLLILLQREGLETYCEKSYFHSTNKGINGILSHNTETRHSDCQSCSPRVVVVVVVMVIMVMVEVVVVVVVRRRRKRRRRR